MQPQPQLTAEKLFLRDHTRNCDCYAVTAAVPKDGRLGQIFHLIEVDARLHQDIQVLLQHVRYRVVPHWRRHKHFQQSGSLAI
jgi:hypothetical protein